MGAFSGARLAPRGEHGLSLERINRRDYSILRALMGEMEAARFAGIMAAKKEQTASAPAAMVNASGSQEETPYNWDETRRPAPRASGSPNSRPSKTRLNAPRRIK